MVTVRVADGAGIREGGGPAVVVNVSAADFTDPRQIAAQAKVIGDAVAANIPAQSPYGRLLAYGMRP